MDPTQKWVELRKPNKKKGGGLSLKSTETMSNGNFEGLQLKQMEDQAYPIPKAVCIHAASKELFKIYYSTNKNRISYPYSWEYEGLIQCYQKTNPGS